jgi:transcriptional regulator with XRE-family HTH domain
LPSAGCRELAAREAAGLARMDCAALVGCCYHFLSLVENGRIDPALPLMQRWADALGVSLDAFREEPANDDASPPKNAPKRWRAA